MKNIIWVVVLVIVIILIAVLSAGKGADNLEINSPIEDRTVDTTSRESELPKTEDSGATPTSAGTYEQYSPEKLAKAETGDVVLFFHAPWCPTCRALDKDIIKNLEILPEGTTILKVDYDTETALKQKYGITYQHTLVQVDTEGNMIAKWSGSPTLTALLQSIK